MRTEIPPLLLAKAQEQYGVITRKQALASGMGSNAIRWRLERGAWQCVCPGVYTTFTGRVDRDARLWTVVLYGGPGAQLSHETAAEILGLTDGRCPLIHLTIPAERRVRPLPGVVIHRSAYIEPGWRFARGVPPHTWVEETVTDLVNAAVTLDDAVGWITRGFQRGRIGEARLKAVMAARKRLRWRDRMDEVISMAAAGTHSALEYRYDRDVERAHGLPPARKQVPFTKPDGTRGFRDRYYDQYGLMVELDGKQYHEDRREHDRRRDNDATAAAGATLRYGWQDVTRTQCETAAQVYQALRTRGYPGRLKPCSAACTARSDPPAGRRQQTAVAIAVPAKNGPTIRI
ncbi:MAG TPA: type IV toxin-antitoxin system AbiEi family antitoxin domain-containing protein [Trebonia sp.]|nr:type IV toxin-antitoxin system AbiEi family antitoxin domain-containing protein [Trebonia sp.]